MLVGVRGIMLIGVRKIMMEGVQRTIWWKGLKGILLVRCDMAHVDRQCEGSCR
jgi:hypothetical protein